MKAGIFVILCVTLVASCVSVRADHTSEQAVARAALEQKTREPDHPVAWPSSDTKSAAAVARPVETATNTTGTLARRAAALPVASASSARADAIFTSKIPAASPSAQAAALAALEQKMDELNYAKAQPLRDTNPITAGATNPVAVLLDAASVSATPVTETPPAEAPVARSPSIVPRMGASLAATPAVVIPAPEVSIAPAAVAAAAVVPTATSGPVAVPTRIQQVAASGARKPSLLLYAMALPPSSPGPVRPANELTTTTGTIYKNVEVEKVMADGILISYTPKNGGWAMTKVYFKELPPEIRQQFGK